MAMSSYRQKIVERAATMLFTLGTVTKERAEMCVCHIMQTEPDPAVRDYYEKLTLIGWQRLANEVMNKVSEYKDAP